MANTIKKHLYIVILRLSHLLWTLCIYLNLYLTLFYYYIRCLHDSSKSSRYDQAEDLFLYKRMKLPKHLALCLTNENRNLNVSSIVDLIIWSKQLGIKFITLYDDHGKLGNQQDQVENILLERVGEPVKGMRILSRGDGRPRFVEIIKDISTLPKDKINLNFVNEQIANTDGCPDPDLLIIFGIASCVYGFPPWQLKTTEIFHLPTHRNIPLEKFVSCLRKYARVEQRVGA